ncbi:MAG TPA: tol-pal system protein YbgF [Candidatus Cloacimonadota bacterium]|nr:tol-pal system protein YbgF [Candidatus Cloacimonadota bacterium]
MKKFLIGICVLAVLTGCVSNKAFKAEKQRVGRMEFQQMKDIENLSTLREEYQQNVLSTDQMMLSLEDELSSLRGELNTLTSGVAEMRAEFTDYAQVTDTQLQIMREELLAATRKISQTEERIAVISEQITELNTASEAQKAQLSELEENLDTSATFNEDVMIDLDQRLEDLRDSITQMQNSLNSQEADARYNALNQKLESMKLVLDGSKSSTTGELSSLRKNIETMEAELAVIGNDLHAISSKTASGAAKTDRAVISYNNAKVFYDKGRYEEAILKLEAFTKAYPDHELVPNALYWIGESYYTAKNYQKAIREFEAVVNRYPAHPKAADAQVKIAMSNASLGDNALAASQLTTFKASYPGYANMALVDKLIKRFSK